MGRRAIVLATLLGLSGTLNGCAHLDPFSTVKHVPKRSQFQPLPPSPKLPESANDALDIQDTCGADSRKEMRLSLREVIRLTLCHNPQTQQSWANIQIAAAQLGSSYAAYLPEIDLTAAFSDGHAQQNVSIDPLLNQSSHFNSKEAALNFNWLIYDGGQRAANLEVARQQLATTQATHDAALLTEFSNAAQAFFQVIAAEATVKADMEAEGAADKSVAVALGRNRGGIAPISEVLQAKTALGQTTVNRIHDEGTLATQRGQLAALIGWSPDTAIVLIPSESKVPTEKDLGDISFLLREAEVHHPSILAAASQLQQQKAQINAAASDGLPNLSLTGNINGERFTGELGLPPPTYQIQDTWGVRLTIPLSEGINRSYQIQQARAAATVSEANLRKVSLSVSLNVWNSYQSLRTDISSLRTANELLATAKMSYEAALGRYQNGIGGIVELIDAQIALASAQQQQIQIESASLADRLQFSASLGRLDLDSVEK